MSTATAGQPGNDRQQPVPDRATQLNNSFDALGAMIAAQLEPKHADAIVTIAQAEPEVFSLILNLVHLFRGSKKS